MQEPVNTPEEIIAQYDSRNKMIGYNVDAGGNTTPRTLEVTAKISVALQKHYEDHDGWNKGGTLTEEWKNKISESHIGLPGTNTGKTFDDEWKMNISKAKTGRKATEETIKKLSKSHLGQIAPNRKLTFDQVRELRDAYNTTKVSQKVLGKKYGISQATVYDIVHNITYKEV